MLNKYSIYTVSCNIKYLIKNMRSMFNEKQLMPTELNGCSILQNMHIEKCPTFI